MTEQTRIPLPGEAKRSLFERAEDQFGLGDFAPAPVPARVADAAVPRGVRKTVRRAVVIEETVEQAASETPAAAPPELEPELQVPTAPDHTLTHMPQPARQREDSIGIARVAFTGEPLPVNCARLREQGLIEPDGPVSALLEEFRLVKRQILLAARAADRPAHAQRVLVSSPLPGEGKTFCAVNLALAMAAEKDSEVVLVDADFAKPSIPAALGLPSGKGLMDALIDPASQVEDFVLATDIHGLFVLPAGNASAHDAEFLASGRTAQVLARLTQGAPNRIVIFDSPPALAASPASELAGHVGQALVVCRADRTGSNALADALSLLSACRDIKLLLNAANFSPSGRRFGTYHGHGG